MVVCNAVFSVDNHGLQDVTLSLVSSKPHQGPARSSKLLRYYCNAIFDPTTQCKVLNLVQGDYGMYELAEVKWKTLLGPPPPLKRALQHNAYNIRNLEGHYNHRNSNRLPLD
jgi:hypothetical protein